MTDIPSQSIEHRCIEYCYTKLGRSSRYSTMHIYAWQIDPPGQSSIHALNTVTPNWGDLPQRTSTYERPFTHEGNYLVVFVNGTGVAGSVY